MNYVKELFHFCNISVKSSSGIAKAIIDFYDLTMVLAGSLTYDIDGERTVLGAGDAILLPPGTERARLSDEAADYASFNFSLADEKSLPLAQVMRGAVSADSRTLLSVFAEEHLSLFYHSTEKAVCILNYILLELLDFKALPSNNPHIRKALRYIGEHTEESITLENLAVHLHLSKEYTASLFKKELGKTVSEYVNEKKMGLAKRMIADGCYSLARIAERLGFEHYGYFSRLFKKHFGISPSRLKQNRKTG